MAQERYAAQSRSGASRETSAAPRHAAEGPQVLTRMPNVGAPEPEYDDDLPFRPRGRRGLGASIAVPILVGSGVLLLALAVLPFALKMTETEETSTTPAVELPEWNGAGPSSWAGAPETNAPSQMPAADWSQPTQPAYAADPGVPYAPQHAPATNLGVPPAPTGTDTAAAGQYQPQPWTTPVDPAPSQSTWPNPAEASQSAAWNASAAPYAASSAASAAAPAGVAPSTWENHPYFQNGQAYPVNADAIEPAASSAPNYAAAGTSSYGAAAAPNYGVATPSAGPAWTTTQMPPADPTQAVGRAMLNGAPSAGGAYPYQPSNSATPPYYTQQPAQAAYGQQPGQSAAVGSGTPNAVTELRPSPSSAFDAAASAAPYAYGSDPYAADTRPQTTEMPSYGVADRRAVPSYGSTPSYGSAQSYGATPATTPNYSAAPSYGSAQSYGQGAYSQPPATVPSYGNTQTGTAPAAGSYPSSYPGSYPASSLPPSAATPAYGTSSGVGTVQPGAAQFQGGIGQPAAGATYNSPY